MSHRYFLCTALLAAGAVRLHALTLDQSVVDFASDSDNYNLISFGSTTLSGSSEVYGGIAVGGNLDLGGTYTIASSSSFSTGSNPSLYVNGQLSLNGNSMQNNGYASLPNLTGGWTWNATEKRLTNSSGNYLGMNSSNSYASDNPIDNPIPSGWNWTTQQSNYTAIAAGLDSGSVGSDTVSVNNSQQLVFSTTITSGVAVFDLDAADLSGGDSYNGSSFDNIVFNIPSGVDYVINVTGESSVTLFNNNISFTGSGNNYNNLLWNFGTATSVAIDASSSFYGSIVAPAATVTANAVIQGQVVADSFDDCGVELEDDSFTPVSVLVPESSAFAVGVLVLCGAVAGRTYLVRRKAAAQDQARAAFVPLAKSVSK
jgi:choice-of-anchor A domain-containing protein